MKTALYTHSDCLAHPAMPGDAECPERIEVILEALAHKDFDDLIRLEAPLADQLDLMRVHTQAHMSHILEQTPAGNDLVMLDYDTAIGAATPRAALRAAGAACAAVDGVMDGSFEAAFCAMRPPGHHAEPNRAMGFCFFSNIAIAAQIARQEYGLTRIAVVDFDVHHGNGTQAALKDCEGMFFSSIYQQDHYPNSGYETDGSEACEIHNVPLLGGVSAEDWRAAFEQGILLPLEAFEPELILVSAGFDAHRDDPLGAFNLTEVDYAWLGEALAQSAKRFADGKLVSVQEGGYNLPALAASVSAYLHAIMVT